MRRAALVIIGTVMAAVLWELIEQRVESTDYQSPKDGPCRAARWHGLPCYEGAHPPHPFRYGPGQRYLGHCAGRTNEQAAAGRQPVGDIGRNR